MSPPTDSVPSDELFYVYQTIKLISMVIGIVLVARTCRVWYQVYDKLTNVIKAYILVFVADIVTVVVYLPNAILEVATGKLYTGPGEQKRIPPNF